MFQITPQQRVWVATAPTDFRKGLDSLAAHCQQQWALNPRSGDVFLFYNRRRTTIKLLHYDGQGFWLCTKRLSSGCYQAFSCAPTHKPPCQRLAAPQLPGLVANQLEAFAD